MERYADATSSYDIERGGTGPVTPGTAVETVLRPGDRPGLSEPDMTPLTANWD